MTGLTRYGVTYGHDASTGRFQAIVAGDITHEQTYLPATNVPLAVNTTGPQASLSRAFDYDGIYRVRGVTNTVDSSTVVSSTAYRYDANNRRARSVREDGTYWEYGYDALGQVTGGRRYVIGGVEPDPLTDDPVPGLDYGYTFDTIGNRTATRTNSHDATWTPNDLNQYTGRAVPGFIYVLGLAHASAEVTVNDITADRTGPANWWYVELSADNSTDAVYEDITVTATIDRAPSADAVAEVSGSRFLPKTPEAFIHDDDGNMTSDGRWTYIWNSENRLVQMETTPAAVLAGVPRQRLTFAYDSQGRRWKKTVARDGVIERTHLFLYDDWNCIREVITEHKVSPEPDHTWARNYVWGLDLSGTMQGAGGVGGLLQVTLDDPHRPPFAFFPCYDGNGNVLALIRDDNTLAATYDYGPFGEQLRADGLWADMCPWRFSTKYQDPETGLNYYGYRYYNAETGRWLNRDPIGERGGENLLALLSNQSTNAFDYLGQQNGRNGWNFDKAVKRVRSTVRDWKAKYPFASRLMGYWVEENLKVDRSATASLPDYQPTQDDIRETRDDGSHVIRGLVTHELVRNKLPSNARGRLLVDFGPGANRGLKSYVPGLFRSWGRVRFTYEATDLKYFRGLRLTSLSELNRAILA